MTIPFAVAPFGLFKELFGKQTIQSTDHSRFLIHTVWSSARQRENAHHQTREINSRIEDFLALFKKRGSVLR
ncbi:MAG: hypothetical protein H7834_00580 [Magnetococcus sp. YQC-9]